MARSSLVQVIVNPVSGRSADRGVLATLCRRIHSAGHRVRVEETRGPGDARRLAAAACHAGAMLLIVSGGDGTISQAVDGLAEGGPPLLIVPTGTANILARYLGIRCDPEFLLRTWRTGREVWLDVPTCNESRFVMVAGAGFDAEAVRVLSARRRGHISYLSYVRPLWETLWNYRHPFLRVETDRQVVFEGPGLALVGNVPRYATGLSVFTRAVPNDGLLDVCVFPCADRAALLSHALDVLFRQHTDRSDVVYRQAREIRISSPQCVPLQLDGDYAGQLPATFSITGRTAGFLVSEGWRMQDERFE
ncbi:MAG: diacylglycerol/lipid kinase family protein [Phycisphaerae bacterium]